MKVMKLIHVVCWCCAFHFYLHATAAEPEWKAGLAKVKITPDAPLVLAGYAGRVKPFEKVDQDLFAKALALQDGQGHRAVLITTDLCFITAKVAAPVFEQITEKTGLRRDEIILSSSHTHSGPYVATGFSLEVAFPASQADAVVQYTRDLQDKLVKVAAEALAKFEPAQLSWGSGIAPNFVMNRREFTAKGVILGVNPRGLVDRTVPILRVDAPDGKPRCVLFSCACHGTTLPSNHLGVSGDYAGYAQAYVEQRHPGAQAMFMMGCGGDANPYPRTEVDLAQKHGAELGLEICRVLETKLQPLTGPLACVSDFAALPLQTHSRAELQKIVETGPGWQTGNARQMIAALERGEELASHYRAPQSVWQIGTNLTLVALSGEVVVDYVPLLEQALGPLRLWIAAYCNDVSGYIPSARILKEGGYETRGLYATHGFFAPAAQDVLIAKIRELAQKAGRQLP